MLLYPAPSLSQQLVYGQDENAGMRVSTGSADITAMRGREREMTPQWFYSPDAAALVREQRPHSESNRSRVREF